MRDIRPDLRERIASIVRERARLDQMEAGIQALLQLEDQAGFTPSNGHGSSVTAGEGGTMLTRLILSILNQAKPRSLTVDDFKAAAVKDGFDFGKKSPGRVLHWALVGMGDAVEKVNGKWRLKEGTQ